MMTPKQAAFVGEYLLDFNGTQAAIRAGYSKKNAESLGYQLLQKTPVQEALKSAMALRAERAERDADAVLRDIREVFLRSRDAGDYRSAIRALELEARHIGMFSKDNNQKRPMVSIIDFTSTDRRVTAGTSADPAPAEPAE